MLLLGGTAEARTLAALLEEQPGFAVTSSLAGRVSRPKLPVGEVRVGGFGGTGGLADYIRAHGVRTVVDATHPFAATISGNASAAAGAVGVPYVRLQRPAYMQQPGDQWVRVPNLAAAAQAVVGMHAAGGAERGAQTRAFITTGRQGLAEFAGLQCWCLVRCVDPPTTPLPAQHELILARGPFDAEAEAELMRDHRITVMVSKDSGGTLTYGKLQAAREVGLPVVMVDRPAPPAGEIIESVDEAMARLKELAAVFA